MQIYYVRTLLFVLIVFGQTVGLTQGCAIKDKNEKETAPIQELSRALQFDAIVNRFGPNTWNERTKYHEVIQYIEALVEREEGLPESIKSPDIPNYLRDFASAYLYLLNGKHKQALAKLSELSRDDWKSVGMLEAAILTRSDSLLSPALEQLADTETLQHLVVDPSITPYYKAIASFIQHESSTLIKILEDNKLLLDEQFYLEFLARELIRQNNLLEAQAIVDSFPEKYTYDQNFIVLKAELIQIVHGPAKAAAYLKKMSQQWPRMWIVKQRYAHALLAVGNIDEGIGILREIALKRKFDVMSLLDLIDVLIDYDRLDEATVLARDINVNQLYTPYIHVVRAKIHARLGREQKMREELQIAWKLAPHNLDVLWAMYDTAYLRQDKSRMMEVLKDIVALDPYSIQAQFDLASIYYETRQWESLTATLGAIKNSGRYIDKDAMHKLQIYETAISSNG